MSNGALLCSAFSSLMGISVELETHGAQKMDFDAYARVLHQAASVSQVDIASAAAAARATPDLRYRAGASGGAAAPPPAPAWAAQWDAQAAPSVSMYAGKKMSFQTIKMFLHHSSVFSFDPPAGRNSVSDAG